MIVARKRRPVNALWGVKTTKAGSTRRLSFTVFQRTKKVSENGHLLSARVQQVTSRRRAIECVVALIFTADTCTDLTIFQGFSLEET